MASSTIAAGERQLGLWLTLGSPYAAEAVAGAGFDWLLLDMEYSPSSLETVLAQLQAISAYPGSAIIRPASNAAVRIKHLLDVGAQTLLIPYVQRSQKPEAAIAAVRYPPRGVRGVSALTRATPFGRVSDYGGRAEDELCLLVQIETRQALENLEVIAAVEGVDGVFVGPDLAASLGFIGEPHRAEVKAAVLDAIARISHAAGPPGCGFRRDHAHRSDLMPPSVPIWSRPPFRDDPARDSGMTPPRRRSGPGLRRRRPSGAERRYPSSTVLTAFSAWTTHILVIPPAELISAASKEGSSSSGEGAGLERTHTRGGPDDPPRAAIRTGQDVARSSRR